MLGRARVSRASFLSVPQAHEPAQADQSSQKVHKAADSVAQPLGIGALRNYAQNDRREQREKNRGFKMGKVHLGHLIFLPNGDFVGVHHG